MYDPNFDWDEVDALLAETSWELPDSELRWTAQDAQVNVVTFDRHRPGRIYTGCWDDANVRCWDIPKVCAEGMTHDRPVMVGEMQVAGFLNAFEQLDGNKAAIAVSAGLIPTPGESLKSYDLSRLPLWDSSQPQPHMPAAQPSPAGHPRYQGQSIFLHARGCRALARSSHELLASLSKDALGVSRLHEGLEVLWSKSHPHDMKEVHSVCWQARQLFSGGSDGAVKAWDIGVEKSFLSLQVCPGTWVRSLAFPADLLLACTSDGLACIDVRTGTVVGRKTGVQAYASCELDATRHLIAMGKCVVGLDLRKAKSQEVELFEMHDLGATVTGLDSFTDDGQVLVLAGCKDGSAALFSTR